MKAPIKLNRAGWPRALTRWLPTADDPRALGGPDPRALGGGDFARAVSVLKFGATFKTTSPGRHREADRVVVERFAGERPVILDIGASDGVTSLDLIRRLGDGFSRYFVTDYNIAVEVGADRRGVSYFRSPSGDAVLAATDRFVLYADTAGAPRPASWLCRKVLGRAPRVRAWREVKLVQPELLRLAAGDARVAVERYDMMAPWTGPAPDLVKMANVLNNVYFTPSQIRAALACQCGVLREGGRLLLVDNRGDAERLSLFRRARGEMVLEESFGGGADAAVHVPREVP